MLPLPPVPNLPVCLPPHSERGSERGALGVAPDPHPEELWQNSRRPLSRRHLPRPHDAGLLTRSLWTLLVKPLVRRLLSKGGGGGGELPGGY